MNPRTRRLQAVKTTGPTTPVATSPNEVEGSLIVEGGARFAIVASRFNAFIVEHLVSGAVDALVRHGASMSRITIVRVPGSWEIPLAAMRLAKS
jgi:6,7-dimethyl-8-ribityllumazine synthase